MKVVSLYLPSDINGMHAKNSNADNTSSSTGVACRRAGMASSTFHLRHVMDGGRARMENCEENRNTPYIVIFLGKLIHLI